MANTDRSDSLATLKSIVKRVDVEVDSSTDEDPETMLMQAGIHTLYIVASSMNSIANALTKLSQRTSFK